MVGRSRAFWERHLEEVWQAFPVQLNDIPLDQFVRAANLVEPSLIRVEADEVTYHLHVFLRFELELALVRGSLAVGDLPAAWNARMRTLVGIVPPHDGLGVLQDVHWSAGLVGYFPTYTLERSTRGSSSRPSSYWADRASSEPASTTACSAGCAARAQPRGAWPKRSRATQPAGSVGRSCATCAPSTRCTTSEADAGGERDDDVRARARCLAWRLVLGA
jgi:hypothetical protein